MWENVPTFRNQSITFNLWEEHFWDLFHENHVAMSMEFKASTDIYWVRSKLDVVLNLGDVMSNFDGFNNISYQFLDQEKIECEE